ncbi:M20 family metallo-hydrolase [candidate division KSB1 bacterium]|nr:M20 family metallo-hydrolase [candidate division KSB1 bacterium]
MTLNDLLALIDAEKETVIDIQKKLVSIQAIGPDYGGTGEKEKADYVKSLLNKWNIPDIKEYNAPDNRVPGGHRPNFIVTIPGKVNTKTIWIMVHLDVVPAGDRQMWNTDPFKLHVENDKIIGRGVEDNHQGLVSALLAIKALQKNRVQPQYNIGLAIVSDEETGNKFGLDYILKNHNDIFKAGDLILVPDAGDEKGKYIEVAEKSILWVKFELEGMQCHASTPELGINAHRAAARLIVELDKLHQLFGKKDPVFDPPISTFEPTKRESNVDNVNTIPGKDVFYLDCRVLPQYSLQDVEKKIKEMVKEVEHTTGVKCSISYPQRSQAAPPTPEDAPVVKALQKAIDEIKKIKAETIGIGGGTVAAFFRRAGFPTAVWSTIADCAHQPNEFAFISNTLDDAKVFLHIFMQNIEP